ncbi:unnamed protein product [Closterium sp. NIES-65]|nr:unnamed protein product [Closterium sp. NIES-65]
MAARLDLSSPITSSKLSLKSSHLSLSSSSSRQTTWSPPFKGSTSRLSKSTSAPNKPSTRLRFPPCALPPGALPPGLRTVSSSAVPRVAASAAAASAADFPAAGSGPDEPPFNLNPEELQEELSRAFRSAKKQSKVALRKIADGTAGALRCAQSKVAEFERDNDLRGKAREAVGAANERLEEVAFEAERHAFRFDAQFGVSSRVEEMKRAVVGAAYDVDLSEAVGGVQNHAGRPARYGMLPHPSLAVSLLPSPTVPSLFTSPCPPVVVVSALALCSLHAALAAFNLIRPLFLLFHSLDSLPNSLTLFPLSPWIVIDLSTLARFPPSLSSALAKAAFVEKREYNEGDFEEDEWEEEDEGEWDGGDADVERALAESEQELSTGSLVLPPGRQAPRVKSAVFVKSSSSVAQCPKDTKIPEFAVIGRSNVGKSSLINMLTNHKGLAQTSKKPGKTQLINHFLINDSWYLVDLPGYGYAVAPNAIRTEWNAFTKAYFTSRTNLLTVLLLVDATIPPQAIDVECADWLGRNKTPLTVVAPSLGNHHSPLHAPSFNPLLLPHFPSISPSLSCSPSVISRRRPGGKVLIVFCASPPKPKPLFPPPQIPLTVVFTKCDRQKKARRNGRPPAVNAALFRAELAECYAELPPWVMTSAVTGEGKDALSWLECYAELLLWVMTSAVTAEGKDVLSHLVQLRGYWRW